MNMRMCWEEYFGLKPRLLSGHKNKKAEMQFKKKNYMLYKIY